MTGAAPLSYGRNRPPVTMADKCKLVQQLFIRNAEIDDPERALWMAVLCKAISDLMPGDPSHPGYRRHVMALRREAVKYFSKNQHATICDFVGLNPDWVNEVLRDHAGLGCDEVI